MEPMNRDVLVLGVKNPQAGLWNAPLWLKQCCVYCDEDADDTDIHEVQHTHKGLSSAHARSVQDTGHLYLWPFFAVMLLTIPLPSSL